MAIRAHERPTRFARKPNREDAALHTPRAAIAGADDPHRACGRTRSSRSSQPSEPQDHRAPRAPGLSVAQLAERGLAGRKAALGLHLVHCGLGLDDEVAALVGARSAALTRRGRAWPDHRAVVAFLHDYADDAVARGGRSPEQDALLVRCKVVAVVTGYALYELERAFDTVDDPAVIASFDEWKGLAEMLIETVATRHAAAARRHYRRALLDPTHWPRLPPRLR